ncbi:hypothetical protein ONS95_004052 [Cadophora gregata]|uniref:uncharacterized protein n=1 Tax=Cadophora gregata TaxID=51156 RepID=UPI0026DB8895|nr:uncharacterized protein ONS95_004052 [Cadophora gregata]KAK0107359.1 hypothetical protein ONS95_004052 [Cadophora gregata]KAK0117037.1 hypothetical protein ONS96_012879 [Cadophora gregata f. sp. sojae]
MDLDKKASNSNEATKFLWRLSRNVAEAFRPQGPLRVPIRVCVVGVGAGVAGLRCADLLLRHGFAVTILEGRDRIGGRVTQTKLSSGHLVDPGVNWIHGTECNPVTDLAKVTNTPTHDWGEAFNVFDADGQVLEDGKKLNGALWGIIAQAF